ncbi:cyclic-di-AMP-binding protein CbpB [Isobaculum melis]|uniref:CBS domain-containing protein n=1 Tax=Isobaculum melis TaxID=142588 RepID=A0A1H9RJE7_9LACT|nr:cyclic-di-AMP-binding protein CbpB [Isobaculum melis]SER72665.1 CBS domain-containing protein [Isobaculum melis]
MIGKKIEAILLENKEHILVPAEKVAHVQVNNRLDHALLVLTKVGYSVIPVLDKDYCIKGLLSLSMITDAILGLEKIDYEKLSEIEVSEVMNTDFPIVENPYDLEEILHLLVDYSFICVASDEGSFTGIVPRKQMMKGLNRLAHEFEAVYHVEEKEPS